MDIKNKDNESKWQDITEQFKKDCDSIYFIIF